MTGKTIPITLATVVTALAFAAPGGAQRSMIPECLESPTLCQPTTSKPSGKTKNQGVRPRTQPTSNGDGTWRAGDRIMY